MWTLARQLTNFHIQELDLANPQFNALGTYDEVYYNRLVNSDAQSRFDLNLREKYGIAPDEYIDIDSFDPNQLSIDMFSADELNENELISYYGYDYKGELLSSSTSIEDFYTKEIISKILGMMTSLEILVHLNLFIPQGIFKINLLSMI